MRKDAASRRRYGSALTCYEFYLSIQEWAQSIRIADHKIVLLRLSRQGSVPYFGPPPPKVERTFLSNSKIKNFTAETRRVLSPEESAKRFIGCSKEEITWLCNRQNTPQGERKPSIRIQGYAALVGSASDLVLARF